MIWRQQIGLDNINIAAFGYLVFNTHQPVILNINKEIYLCIILQEITYLLSTHSFWRQLLINQRSPCMVHITVSWFWAIFTQWRLMSAKASA